MHFRSCAKDSLDRYPDWLDVSEVEKETRSCSLEGLAERLGWVEIGPSPGGLLSRLQVQD
jgi:hypothetical protein